MGRRRKRRGRDREEGKMRRMEKGRVIGEDDKTERVKEEEERN